jgi:hypothetical protein
VANQQATLGNLHLARKQLDELDALVQKMLNLPEAAPGNSSDEASLASQGIYNPLESPWASMTEKNEALSQKEKSPVNYKTNENILPSDENELIPESPAIPATTWKPSSLTWGPLAEAWEQKNKGTLATNPIAKQEAPPIPPKVLLTEEKKPTTFPTISDETKPLAPITPSTPKISKIPDHQKTSGNEMVQPSKGIWMDVLGFVGIMLMVFAAVLFFTGSFPWPAK